VIIYQRIYHQLASRIYSVLSSLLYASSPLRVPFARTTDTEGGTAEVASGSFLAVSKISLRLLVCMEPCWELGEK
jgi:hypothetical protein